MNTLSVITTNYLQVGCIMYTSEASQYLRGFVNCIKGSSSLNTVGAQPLCTGFDVRMAATIRTSKSDFKCI